MIKEILPLVLPALPDYKAKEAHKVPQALAATLESTEVPVAMVSMVHKVQKVTLAHLEIKVQMVHKVFLVSAVLVSQVPAAQMVLLVSQVLLATQDDQVWLVL